MSFIPSLHLNTEYSLLESSIKIDDLITLAKANDATTLVITDRNNMHGASEFINKCKKNNIKPVIGIDLDVDDYRLILLAKNYIGYQHLMELSSRKMSGEVISLKEIYFKDIFVIDHPTLGHYATKKESLNIENYFIGVNESSVLANEVLIKETKILHDKSENEALSILHHIKTGEFKTFDYEPYDYNLDMADIAVQQAMTIISHCEIIFPDNQQILPKYETEESMPSLNYLKKIVQDAAKTLFSEMPNKEIYIKRIKYEISIIGRLGFEDYFLIIWDLVKWAKQEKIIVGPGRGSAAGSLISYILGITEIDPIEYDLLFERFLNPKRVSMPDIDIDFQDDRRADVLKYLFEKYGEDHVALISTFQRLGAKMSLRDVGRYKKINNYEIDMISKLIKFNLSLSEAYDTNNTFKAIIDKSAVNTELFKLAKKIEGLPRQIGTHAAGVVISDEVINKKAPTIKNGDGLQQIQFPMDYLEENNLLKIDILGLRNLTILKDIVKGIKKSTGKTIALRKISLSDKKTNELLSAGDTNGVFQLESYGMKKTLAHVHVESLSDLVDIISLFRPGPMEFIEDYVKGRKEGIVKINSSIDPILKETNGIIVYQEQIMRIVQEFSGMDFGKADVFRRAIGKKDTKLLHSMKSDFDNGAKEKGHDEIVINKVYNLIEKFANYGFNKSHAVSYGILAYRLAYLKARFPREFFVSLINSSIGSPDTIKKYINESKQKGIRVVGPTINYSEDVAILHKEALILPLTIIKGLGKVQNEKLMDALKIKRDFKDFIEAIVHLNFHGITPGILTTLVNANVFRKYGNMTSLIDTLPSVIRFSKMVIVNVDGKVIVDETVAPRPMLISQERDINYEVTSEISVMGTNINVHYTTPFETKDNLSNIPEGQTKNVYVYYEKKHLNKMKNGEDFARILVSDSTNSVEITAFASVWKFIKSHKTNTIYKARIKRKSYKGMKGYILEEPWEEVQN